MLAVDARAQENFRFCWSRSLLGSVTFIILGSGIQLLLTFWRIRMDWPVSWYWIVDVLTIYLHWYYLCPGYYPPVYVLNKCFTLLRPYLLETPAGCGSGSHHAAGFGEIPASKNPAQTSHYEVELQTNLREVVADTKTMRDGIVG